MNITDTQITPAQLLTAAREGKITATVIDSETLTPLAGGDGPEQYPSCTIALQIEQPDLSSITSLPGVLSARALPAEPLIVGVQYMPGTGDALIPMLPGSIVHSAPDGAVLALHAALPRKIQTIRTIRAWKLVYYSTDGDTLNGGRGTYDFREVSSDGATRGDATVTIEREAPAPQQCEPEDADDTETPAAIVISTGESSTPEEISIAGLTEDEAEEIREAIESAIDEAYSDWSPEHPDESEIYEALTKSRETSEVEYLVGGTKNHAGEFVRVRLYAGTHCGQPQFALEPMDGDEDTTVYDDASDAASAAREKLVDLLQAAIDDTDALDKQEREAAEALEASLRDDE